MIRPEHPFDIRPDLRKAETTCHKAETTCKVKKGTYDTTVIFFR